MKTPRKQKNYTLGDLIMAVSSYAKSNAETVSAVVDLLASGKARFPGVRRIQIR